MLSEELSVNNEEAVNIAIFIADDEEEVPIYNPDYYEQNKEHLAKYNNISFLKVIFLSDEITK